MRQVNMPCLAFFDSLRIELSDQDVSVTMVYPSFVATRGRKVSCAIMSVETCAQSIVEGVVQRKREIFLPSMGVAGLWLRLIAPAALDRYLCKVRERQDISGSNAAEGSAKSDTAVCRESLCEGESL